MRHDDVEVGEHPQTRIAPGLHGERRAFPRQRGHTGRCDRGHQRTQGLRRHEGAEGIAAGEVGIDRRDRRGQHRPDEQEHAVRDCESLHGRPFLGCDGHRVERETIPGHARAQRGAEYCERARRRGAQCVTRCGATRSRRPRGPARTSCAWSARPRTRGPSTSALDTAHGTAQ
jgi:hypothetical protein